MPRAASSTASELASTVGGAVLVVSYILPLSIQRAEGGGWAVEWNYDAVTAKKAESLTARKRVVWIGCPGIATEEDERESLAEKLQEFDSVPVFLEPEMQRTFYFALPRLPVADAPQRDQGPPLLAEGVAGVLLGEQEVRRLL